MLPSVSVIMPVYNVEEYVAEAISSVLGQTYSDFEFLIIDDGSSDSSIEICRAFNDPRIRLIRQPNKGLAGARNTGIREAKGQFLAFIDSDDLWASNKLELNVAHLNANANVGVSYGPSKLMDENGKLIGIMQKPKLSNISSAEIFLRNPVGNGSAPVIRREVFGDIGFAGPNIYTEWFDESFRQSEDIECWMRIALTTNWRFEGVSGCITFYRVNKYGLSAQMDAQFASWKRMTQKVKNLDYDFFEKWHRLGEAYQLRYLSRRATRMRDGRMALKLIIGAIFRHTAIIYLDPKKTIQTLGAAVALCALPKKSYEIVERKILNRSTLCDA